MADKIATDVIEAAGAHVEPPLAPKAPWWRWWWGNQRWRRLASAVVAYDLVLRGRAQQDATLAAGLSAIRTALKSASDALETGDIDRGWKCFHNAQQIELLHLGDAQLCAAAMAIRSEADKLGGWRKAAVMKLLDRDCCETGLKAGVFQAARIRDEHYDNEAYKDGLRRRRSLCFASILGIVVAALLGLSWGKSLPSAGSLNETDMLLSMAMFVPLRSDQRRNRRGTTQQLLTYPRDGFIIWSHRSSSGHRASQRRRALLCRSISHVLENILIWRRN